MNSSDKMLFCRVLLFIILILTAWQIMAFFKKSHVLIETEIEGFNNADGSKAVFKPKHDGYDMPFNVRNNRYLAGINGDQKKTYCNCGSNCNCSAGLPCGPQDNWAIEYNAGANNVTGDTIWHTQSPRMTLQNTCLNCQRYTSDKVYNEPEGVSSDLTLSIDGTLKEGSVKYKDLY